MKLNRFTLTILSVLLVIIMLLGTACGTAPAPTATPVPPPPATKAPALPSPTPVPPTATAVPPTATAVPVNEAKLMAEAADKYLASGKPPTLTADKLYENLNDGDAANDPYILDIRSAADFAKGHIKGAVNVGFANVFKAETLAKLPKDKQIVVSCYTGHTASMAAFALDAMGYNAIPLKWSQMGWSKNDEPLGAGKRFPAEQKDYAIETKANDATKTYSLPSVKTGKTAVADIIAIQADTFLSNTKSFTIMADKLFENLNDGDTANDPFVLDLRSAADYEKGHVKGSVNIPFASAFKAENLAKLPTDKQIVVVCYTGHTASMTGFFLNVMGYNAIPLKWGIMGWTKNDAPLGAVKRFPAEQKDYPIVK